MTFKDISCQQGTFSCSFYFLFYFFSVGSWGLFKQLLIIEDYKRFCNHRKKIIAKA